MRSFRVRAAGIYRLDVLGGLKTSFTFKEMMVVLTLSGEVECFRTAIWVSWTLG